MTHGFVEKKKQTKHLISQILDGVSQISQIFVNTPPQNVKLVVFL